MASESAPPPIKGDFNSAYTQANISKDASPYDGPLFQKIRADLESTEPTYLSSFSYALVSVMFCAQRRGDAVGTWFRDLIQGKPEDEITKTFETIREAITVTYPFIGLPNCVTACFGLVGAMRELGLEVKEGRSRPDAGPGELRERGLETRDKIYRGVGNPEVHWMMNKYFPDMTYATDNFIFGYLAGFSLDIKKTELCIAAAIVAMGATRQSRSHVKAAMQLGNSKAVLKALVVAAEEVAQWNKQPLPAKLDVDSLEEELEANLASEQR